MEKFNTKELRFCESCANDMCIDCTVETLEKSVYGNLLKAMKPRFGYFQWEDEARFRKYMGDDVDPLKHGVHQAEKVAIPFIEHQNSSPWHQPFTRGEAKMLVIGNCLHDLHEGLTGDIAVPDKTDDIYEAELEVNLECVADLLQLKPESDFMQSYRAIVGDLKGWSHAGRAFNAIERCGYFLTGLDAWAMRNHSDLDDDERLKCREMGYAVITANVPILQDYSREFVYPAYLLRANEKAISEVL